MSSLSTCTFEMSLNIEHVKCVTSKFQIVQQLCFCFVPMVEKFNYLYLDKLGKLSKSAKRILENLN